MAAFFFIITIFACLTDKRSVPAVPCKPCSSLCPVAHNYICEQGLGQAGSSVSWHLAGAAYVARGPHQQQLHQPCTPLWQRHRERVSLEPSCACPIQQQVTELLCARVQGVGLPLVRLPVHVTCKPGCITSLTAVSDVCCAALQGLLVSCPACPAGRFLLHAVMSACMTCLCAGWAPCWARCQQGQPTPSSSCQLISHPSR